MSWNKRKPKPKKKRQRRGCYKQPFSARVRSLMAEDSQDQQVQTAVQILFNAASQARLTAADHDQVKQAAQIVASKLGLTEAPTPEIQMPDGGQVESSEE